MNRQVNQSSMQSSNLETHSCAHCKSSKSSIELKTVGFLCQNCFTAMIERRFKKYVRLIAPFKPREKVALIDDSSTNANVAKELLKVCLGGLPLEIKVITPKDLENYLKNNNPHFDKILLPFDGDDVAVLFLDWLFKADQDKLTGIPFLEPLLDEEIQAYAKCKGIEIKPKNSSDLLSDLKRLDDRYPGAVQGILKSARLYKELAKSGKVSAQKTKSRKSSVKTPSK